jgi:uncharacterized protein (UPF0548 family)
MLFLLKPGAPAIERLLKRHERASFSYENIGATRTAPPPGWGINHMRQLIGSRQAAYEKACAALFSWQLLAISGLEVFPSTPELRPGTDVAILSRHFGVWSVDFCRVIYVLRDEREKDGTLLRTGFAYGTLPGHAVRGEEIFSIEWHPATEEVWYDIYSFSLPATPLIKLLAPIARATQRRFARASLEAGRRAAEPEVRAEDE